MEKRYWQITYFACGDELPASILIESTSVLDAINECGLSDLDSIIDIKFVPMVWDIRSDTKEDK